MNGNEGHWGGGISIISQNFPKSPSILFYPLNPPFPKQTFTPTLQTRHARPLHWAQERILVQLPSTGQKTRKGEWPQGLLPSTKNQFR
jgi:hypothetical protein